MVRVGEWWKGRNVGGWGMVGVWGGGMVGAMVGRGAGIHPVWGLQRGKHWVGSVSEASTSQCLRRVPLRTHKDQLL